MVRKKTKINKQNHTDIHTCPRKHISEGARIQPIFCCSPFSYFSFFLLCSLRKTISLLGLIIIRHRVEFWPSKGGCLRSRFNPGLTSWAWWWVQVLWEADPEACTYAQVFMWNVQGRVVGEYRSDPRKGWCVIKPGKSGVDSLGKTQHKIYASDMVTWSQGNRGIYTPALCHLLRSAPWEVPLVIFS